MHVLGIISAYAAFVIIALTIAWVYAAVSLLHHLNHRIHIMSAALDRLTASVDALVTAVAAIPPAAPDDSAQLNALADKVDAATASITPAPAPEV